MPYEHGGKTIDADKNGYLTDINDWNKELAEVIAATENIELTQRHWDVINYLRDEYINNAGSQPNMRKITKAMKVAWDDSKIDTKAIYQLYPLGPSKQAGKIAGLPESRRKGGY